ncbi:tRNA N(3)-methylcytidine methyltransferase METTL6-like [Zophobas morio]|uniref:tRNA N(3)-methylcytidine methyltransferase METTL6-like n=1 Tax=Zophobas morio TaxID=2755281 RepID=UPI003082D3F7
MFFVLSAIPPLEMRKALQPIYQVLKPGGTVVFRDYGIYDHAMLRFKQGHKLSDNLYVRQDGTLAYYFSLEFLQELFSSQGFQVVSNEYLFTETINRKEKINVERVFVQSRFLKKKE